MSEQKWMVTYRTSDKPAEGKSRTTVIDNGLSWEAAMKAKDKANESGKWDRRKGGLAVVKDNGVGKTEKPKKEKKTEEAAEE